MMLKKAFTYLSLFAIVYWIYGCQGNSGSEQIDRIKQIPRVEADSKYIMQGKIVAQTTASSLTAELSKALTMGGVEHAIGYCNHRAVPILDSLSYLYRAKVRRTSTKVRNKENNPLSEEWVILQSFEEDRQNGRLLQPTTKVDKEGKAHFYAPIFVQPFCLSCHGKPGVDLNEKDYETILNLYPEDQATGYQAGDLRGMWSITFEQ